MARLDDPDRIAAIARAAVLDTAPEESFDRLTRLASKILSTAGALVTIVDDHRQFFKSQIGIAEPWAARRETPLSHSFCKLVVGSGDTLVVEDARLTPSVASNRAVDELGVIAYVGIPLVDVHGFVLGAFAIVDTKPRKWRPEDIAVLEDLTRIAADEIERRVATRHAEESRRLLQGVIESMQDPVLVSDPKGHLVLSNPAADAAVGRDLAIERARGFERSTTYGFFAPDGVTPYPDDELPVRQALRGESVRGLEMMLRPPGSNHAAWYDVNATPIRQGDDIIAGVLVARDVTRIKEAEKAKDETLHALERALDASLKNEGRFRAAIDGMRDAFVLLEAIVEDGRTVDFRLIEVNAVAAALLGGDRTALVGKRYASVESPAAYATLLPHLLDAFDRHATVEQDMEIRRDGVPLRWAHVRVYPLEKGVAIVSTDMTAAQTLERERRLHAAILQNMTEGLCVVRTADERILFANPKFERMHGYDVGELAGKPLATITDVMTPEEARVVRRDIGKQIRAKGEATIEIRDITKDGRRILCRATTSRLQDTELGDVHVGVYDDITTQHAIRTELDGFFTLSLDLLAVVGLDGKFKRVNAAWEAALGWSADELLAAPWVSWVHPDDVGRTLAEAERVLQGQRSMSFENRLRTRDGSYRTLSWRAASSEGTGLIYATARDVTEHRAREAALRDSLAEKEVLLQEVHHRVKNNLQIVSSLLRLHGERVSDPAAKDALRESRNRVRAIAVLHESLYRSKNLATTPFAEYVADLVRTILRAAAGTQLPAVTIEADGVALDFDTAVPCGLILNELLTNAVKHAFDGVDAPAIAVRAREEGGHVELSIADNGCGAPAGFAERGTLGLQIIRALATQLRAKTEVVTEGGTRWTFRFPVDAEA